MVHSKAAQKISERPGDCTYSWGMGKGSQTGQQRGTEYIEKSLWKAMAFSGPLGAYQATMKHKGKHMVRANALNNKVASWISSWTSELCPPQLD